MWIIATWIILFLDLLFICEFDATLLFVNEKKTFYEALKICNEDYGARIATEMFLRLLNLLNQRNKLSKCVPSNTKIWFTELRNSARQAGKWYLEQEVWWFTRAGLQRQLVRINSHHYFLCYKDGEISELNDHSAIVCNDDLEPVTNSGNSFNPRTTRLVTTEKKSSETTTWRHHHSRSDRNLFTGRPYSSDSLLSSWHSDGPTTSDITTSTGRDFISQQVNLSTALLTHKRASVDSEHSGRTVSSDSLIGTRNTGGPTSSDITANTGRDFISRQEDLNTAIPAQGNASVDCTPTMEIAIIAALGLIVVILLSAVLRLIYSRRKECAASQQTYEICDLDRRAVINQNRDDIYDLPFQVTDRPASRPYENT